MEVNMYTWGYIKDAALAKINIDTNEANDLGLLNRFKFYANEVITRVSSAIKPKRCFWEVNVTREDVGKTLTIDDPMFISFGNDISTVNYYDFLHNEWLEKCHDDTLEYKGFNQFVCKIEGKYKISYNARWFLFDGSVQDDLILPVPMDILECIPSYIAHQCLKMDNEYKSAVYRNEYEMMLASIDDTDFKPVETFKIKGDW